MKTDKIIIAGGLVVMALFMFLSTKDMPITGYKGQISKAGLNWYTSLDKGMQESINAGKPVLVYFWAPWCTYCKQMEENVYPNPGVNDALKNDFVLVALNIDENGELAGKFGVAAPPAEIFLKQDGREITRVPGYLDAPSFLSVLQDTKGS